MARSNSSAAMAARSSFSSVMLLRTHWKPTVFKLTRDEARRKRGKARQACNSLIPERHVAPGLRMDDAAGGLAAGAAVAGAAGLGRRGVLPDPARRGSDPAGVAEPGEGVALRVHHPVGLGAGRLGRLSGRLLPPSGGHLAAVADRQQPA